MGCRLCRPGDGLTLGSGARGELGVIHIPGPSVCFLLSPLLSALSAAAQPQPLAASTQRCPTSRKTALGQNPHLCFWG